MNPPTLPNYIKPGAFVKLRNGSKGEIYTIDNAEPYIIHGRTSTEKRFCSWTNNLNVWSSGEGSDQDIIGPWSDAPDCSRLWLLLPPWIKYLAMDANNEWYSYSLKPYQWQGGNWFHNSLECSVCYVPKDYAPIYSGDWKDSLVERPS